MSKQNEHQQAESVSIKEDKANEVFYFERKKRERPSQLLSMKRFKVHKDINQRHIMTAKSCLQKKNANKMLDSTFPNQEIFLSNLCKKKKKIKRQQIKQAQGEYLNSFNKNSSPQTRNKREQYEQKHNSQCQTPSIVFKLEQNALQHSNNSQNQKFISKKLIAKAFVYYNYGYGSFTLWMRQKQQQEAMQFSKYRNLVAVIMTQCYRRLQNFIIQQCRMNIRRLNRAQIKLILIILLNCRQRIKQQSETYLQYVKLCFFLENVTITANSSVQLYQAIYQALKKRVYQKSGQSMNIEQRHPGSQSLFNSKGGFTHNQRFQLHRIWNANYEREFLEFYQNQSDLQSISHAFQRKYPSKRLFFNEFSLKLRLNKILRESLKKIQLIIQSEEIWSLPQLQKLSKNSYKAILENGNLYGIRLMLLQISKEKICEIEQIKQAIITLNQFIAASQPFEKKYHLEKQPYIDQEKLNRQTEQYSLDINLEGQQQSQISLNGISDFFK